MDLVCPKCSAKFGSERDSGSVKCPECAAEFRAEAQSDTMVVTPRPGGGPPPVDVRGSVPPEFARYRIEEVIGRGGMGVVYRAQDPELKRTVALKVLLSADHASGEEIQRFLREAESAAKLQHPNIVPIHELGEHAGKHYYTMDLIEGSPLDELIDGEKLGLRDGMAILEKVARGLEHAHAAGVVHRDLKPANIIVGTDGEPRITDFGLAKIVQAGADDQSSPRLTISGVAMGTPHYMAPEQAAGRSHQVDARSDVYALGCIMYELMTGAPPFVAEGAMEVLRKQVEEDPVSPSRRGANVSVDVETICLKCLEKEPERRYASAGELAADIRCFLDGEPVTARRASMAYLLRKKLMRYRAIAAVVVGATLALVGASAWYVLDLRDKQQQIRLQRDRAVTERNRAEEAARKLLREQKRTTFQLYRYGVAEASRLSGEKRFEDALETLRSLPARHRGWEYRHLLRKTRLGLYPSRWEHRPKSAVQCLVVGPGGRLLATASVKGGVEIREIATGKLLKEIAVGQRSRGGSLNGLPATIRGLAFDPTGKKIAVGTFAGQIGIRDVKTGKEEYFLQAASFVGDLSFAADGKRLVSGGERVQVWDLETRKAVLILPGRQAQDHVALSPDGKFLAAGSADGRVRVWDVANGRNVRTMDGNVGLLYSLAWSPAGGLLVASGTRSRGVVLWDVKSGKQSMRLAGELKSVYSVSFSPDGRLLAGAVGDNTVRVWNLLFGRQAVNLKGRTAVKFSSDGKVLLTGGAGMLKAWSVQHGWAVFHLTAHKGFMNHHALSPDSKLLATSSGFEVKVWQRPQCRLLGSWKKPRDSRANVNFLAYSPDSRQLAMACSDGRVRLADPRTAEVARSFRAFKTGASACAWSPDGKRMAVSGWSDKSVRIFEVSSGRLLRELEAVKAGAMALAWSPDGRRLAAGGRFGHPLVLLWDLEGEGKPRRLEGHKGFIHCVVFSRDSRLLASSGVDPQVRVWDAKSGERRLELRGHAGPVRALAFGPEGRRLVSGSEDLTVRFWDLASGDQTVELRSNKFGFLWLEFSADGRRLFASDDIGTVRIWVADPPESP